MIRKITCLLLFVLTVASARADDRGRSLIRSLASKMAAYKSYEVAFSAGMDGEFGDVPGRIVVSGDRYYIDVNGSQLFCDGKLLYTYNADEDEVTIEAPDPGDNSLLSNPSRFFRLGEGDFDATYKGSAKAAGRSVELVDLTPKTANAGYHSILLKIDAATGLPADVEYRPDGASSPVRIAIGKITPEVPVTNATFTFDKSKYKGVEVIDLR